MVAPLPLRKPRPAADSLAFVGNLQLVSILRHAEQEDGLLRGDAADRKLEAVGQQGADPLAHSYYCRPLGDVGIARIVRRRRVFNLAWMSKRSVRYHGGAPLT
jgi:hypothetical protein